MSESLYKLNATENNEYKLLLESINEIVWKADLATYELVLIGKFNDISGYNNMELTSLNDYADKVIIPEDREMVYDEFSKFVAGNSIIFNIQYRIITKFGQFKWILVSGKRVRFENDLEDVLVGTVTDITERKKSEEQIRIQAYRDQLTNLPNRACFMYELRKLIDNPGDTTIRSAVLLIDIDNFSSVNDSYGHSYGDVLLKLTSQLIKSCIKDYGMVTRVGGDEFLVLIPNIKNRSQLSKICKSIIDSFQNPFEILDIYTYVTASIGISVFQGKDSNADQIFKNADVAIHQAKIQGKNIFVFYTEELGNVVKRKKMIESNLQNALEKDEFEIYYQYQVDINNNKIRGIEALLRWNSPKLGSVSPSEFIPIAEETGLIDKIGTFVLKKACEQAKEWKDEGYCFDTISVNISPKQLHKRRFQKFIEKILEESKLDPKYLEIEITEGTLMKCIEDNSKLLEKLINKDIKISIDDFGKGYSSLNYLASIPISTLKIDKSFIDKICQDNKALSIVECIIQLSKKLHYNVIAEGVESADQKQLLYNMGCTYIQGFYYSKPVPASELEEILKDKGMVYA